MVFSAPIRVALGAALLVAPAFAATPNLAGAEKLLNRGRVDEAIAQLKGVNTPDAHLLLCRAFYAEEHADEAVTECEAALAGGLANSSVAQDWMGRAYGQKAAHDNYLSAIKTASKVRSAFETAAQLGPKNKDAVGDLGEFYANAPGMVGGGADKAHALADRSAAALPQAAFRVHAMAAESQHDYGTAEREFKSAVSVANRADALADLGDFYGRRKQYDQQLDALQKAVAADKPTSATTVDAAESLITAKKHTDIAEQWLRAYLANGLQTDAQPVFRVHVALGKLLAKRGDKAGAKVEFNKALALAANYEPAQKALRSL